MQWFVGALALLLISTDAAYAYLDPGTGSFILQMILAGALAVGASIKLYWQRIKSIWVRFASGAGVHDRK